MGIEQLDVLIKALEISPENTVLRKHVAQQLLNFNRVQEALENYQLIIAANPDDLESTVSLVDCLIKLARYDEAMEWLNQRLKVNPEWSYGLISMAKIWFTKEEYEKAMECYERAVDKEPELSDNDFYQELLQHTPSRKVKLKVVEFRKTTDAEDILERPELTFNDVGGMEEVKENIQMNIVYPLQNPEIYKMYGKKAGGGILLYGPPGCGKTFIARATAGECNAHFINLAITDILDMYIGESEKNLHTIFQTARLKAPSVIFIDEIDAIGGSRQTMRSSLGRSLTNQLLVELDGLQNNNTKVLIIGATNSPWFVDSALRRPGRFDRIIFVPPPDLNARVEILKLHLRDRSCKDIDYAKLASNMVNYSGADISCVCDLASEKVIKYAMKTGNLVPIQTEDLMDALKQVKPSTIEWLNSAKNYATYSNQSGIYDDVIDYFKKF